MNGFLANFISINCGMAASFVLNTYFNFRKTNRISIRAASFFAVGYMGLLLSMSCCL